MLRSKFSFLVLVLICLSSLCLQGCGGDSGRKQGLVTDYSNYVDLRLNSLSFDQGELSPAFDPDFVGPYTLSLAADVESIDITAVAADETVSMDIAKREYQVDENGVPVTDENGNYSYDFNAEYNLIEAGEVDTKTILAGDNSLYVQLISPETGAIMRYTIIAHRADDSALLSSLRLFDLNAGTELALDPEFEPATTDGLYTTSIPYSSCTISLRGNTLRQDTQYSVNAGDSLNHGDSLLLNPSAGTNNYSVVTQAGYGDATETYSVVVNRVEGTETELAADATLSNLEIGNVDVSGTFICEGSGLLGSINRDTTTFQLTATPSVAGATIKVGEPVVVDGIITALDDSALTVEAGVAIDVPVELADVFKAVEVTSADGGTTRYYQLIFTRLDTNQVKVETAAELQAALKNAEPGDEILLTASSYVGEVSADASGDLSSHFFSDRSGTADSPIILRSESSSDFAELLGSDLAENSVLKISGDYWQIRYLQIGNAANGIVLDSANNNRLENLSFDSFGERAVVMANGSSNNQLRTSSLTNTGLVNEAQGEAVVIGSPAEDWASAPSGTVNEQDYDNAIRSNVFGPNIAAEAIELKEGTLRTQVQYNVFNAEGISASAEDNSLIVIKANDSNVSYNTFYNTSATGLSALVTAQNVSHDWVTQNWGENNDFYQNIADLGGAEIPLVDSSDVATLYVAENSRDDEVDVSYTGSGINSSFEVPVYQLQTAVDEPLCLSEERPYLSRSDIDKLYDSRPYYPLIYNQQCADDAAQQWKLLNAGDGYVNIVPADIESRILVPATPSYISSGGSYVVTIDPEDAFPLILSLADGYMLQWLPVHTDGEVAFLNRSGLSASYVLAGAADEGATATIDSVGDVGDYGGFVLIEQ